MTEYHFLAQRFAENSQSIAEILIWDLFFFNLKQLRGPLRITRRFFAVNGSQDFISFFDPLF